MLYIILGIVLGIIAIRSLLMPSNYVADAPSPSKPKAPSPSKPKASNSSTCIKRDEKKKSKVMNGNVDDSSDLTLFKLCLRYDICPTSLIDFLQSLGFPATEDPNYIVSSELLPLLNSKFGSERTPDSTNSFQTK